MWVKAEKNIEGMSGETVMPADKHRKVVVLLHYHGATVAASIL